MARIFLNSKIHKATVTGSEIDYEGSCEIDVSLMKAAGIRPYEKIDIYNLTNGERFSTYVIEGKPETGTICINGAACHKASVNDKIIICTYTNLEKSEYLNHKPTVVYVDNHNKIIEKDSHKKISIA